MPRHANATSYGGKHGNPSPEKGSPPGPGRPPASFGIRMRTILERTKTAENIERVLDDPDHPHYPRILDLALNRGLGPVPSEHAHKHSGTVRVHVIYDDERPAGG